MDDKNILKYDEKDFKKKKKKEILTNDEKF